jgi:thioredoxin-related protein
MKNKRIILTGFLLLVLIFPACAAEPLPSWNKGASNLHFAHGEIKFQDLYHLSLIMRLTCLYCYK